MEGDRDGLHALGFAHFLHFHKRDQLLHVLLDRAEADELVQLLHGALFRLLLLAFVGRGACCCLRSIRRRHRFLSLFLFFILIVRLFIVRFLISGVLFCLRSIGLSGLYGRELFVKESVHLFFITLFRHLGEDVISEKVAVDAVYNFIDSEV